MNSVELLQRMVEIESLSGGERPLAEFLVATMQEMGFLAHIDAVGNAVGVKGKGEDDFVLLGHMDTVPGVVPLRREGDRLYGRGSVDAKGPLAAFISAAAQVEPAPGKRLVVVGAVEEEAATSKGARHVAAQFQPKFCIIGEPSGWDAVTIGYKGRMLIDYRRRQEVGHTAGPHGSAADAFVAWWRGILEYSKHFNREHQRLFDQLLPTLRHIHTTSDGLTEEAQATAGFRLPPDFDISDLERKVCDLAETAEVKCYAHEPAFSGSRSNPLARAFIRALRQAQVRPSFKRKTGTSDMNVVGPAWNCPILAYGPGDSNLDHTPQEHILVSEYLRAIEILREVLAQLI